MDVQFLKDWGAVIATAIAIGTAGYTWLTAGSKNNSEHLAKVDDRLADHGVRITALEGEVSRLPDGEDLTALKLDIADMKGSFGRMEEQMSGVSRTVHRVEDYLLKKGGV